MKVKNQICRYFHKKLEILKNDPKFPHFFQVFLAQPAALDPIVMMEKIRIISIKPPKLQTQPISQDQKHFLSIKPK